MSDQAGLFGTYFQMRREERRADARRRILDALSCGGEHPGYDLMKLTRMGSGRLYVTLAEMEQAGEADHGKRTHEDGLIRHVYRLPQPTRTGSPPS